MVDGMVNSTIFNAEGFIDSVITNEAEELLSIKVMYDRTVFF